MTELYHAVQLPLFVTSKICPKCDPPTEKSLDEFPKDRHRKDGHGAYCKKCASLKSHNYHVTHAEQRSAYDRARNQTPERKAYHRARDTTPERKAYYRKWQSTPEQIEKRKRNPKPRKGRKGKPHSKEYYRMRNALPQIKAQKSQYYHANRAHLRQLERIRNKANPIKRLSRDARRRGRKRNVIVQQVSYERILERDGMVCHICEQPILPHHKLEFDHVVPLARGGSHTEENIKPSHQQCNRRKKSYLMEELTPWHRRGVAS